MKFLINATMMLLVAGGTFWLVVTAREAVKGPEVQTYLFNMRGQILSVQGTRLENTGFCTQVWMHSRLDAIVCEPHLVVPEARVAEERKPVVY